MIIFFKKTNQNKFHLNTQKLSVQVYLVKTFVKKTQVILLKFIIEHRTITRRSKS